jgi:hypothetical protein
MGSCSPLGEWQGIIGPRIGGVLYDRYHNYQAAFYTAAVLAGVALLCELGAKRPAIASGPPVDRSLQHGGRTP